MSLACSSSSTTDATALPSASTSHISATVFFLDAGCVIDVLDHSSEICQFIIFSGSYICGCNEYWLASTSSNMLVFFNIANSVLQHAEPLGSAELSQSLAIWVFDSVSASGRRPKWPKIERVPGSSLPDRNQHLSRCGADLETHIRFP